MRPSVEIWSPLPPQASGIADYVHEQLPDLARGLDLSLVVEDPNENLAEIRETYRVISPSDSDPQALRLYHLGNSPLHGFIYREAIRVPGVVVMHEWNLHELLLGFAVTANAFEDYRSQLRREHGERGSVAAGTVGSALGGRHWSSVFPLNAEVLEGALAVVCPSASTAARAAARLPGGLVLHLPLHALVRAAATNRSEARARLKLDPGTRIVLAPGLGTASKSLDVAREAVAALPPESGEVLLVTVGGGSHDETLESRPGTVRHLGRVEMETLGDALLAADIVLALRFPSRGESSAVLMRALAAGRASIVSSGSTADEDLPEGVVAKVNPGPGERRELTALLNFLLRDHAARERMERLSLEVARTRPVAALADQLVEFLKLVARERSGIEAGIAARSRRASGVRERFRHDLEAAASSLGLAHVPPGVFEKVAHL